MSRLKARFNRWLMRRYFPRLNRACVEILLRAYNEGCLNQAQLNELVARFEGAFRRKLAE